MKLWLRLGLNWGRVPHRMRTGLPFEIVRARRQEAIVCSCIFLGARLVGLRLLACGGAILNIPRLRHLAKGSALPLFQLRMEVWILPGSLYACYMLLCVFLCAYTMCVCAHLDMQSCMHACMHACMHDCLYVCIQSCLQARMRVRKAACPHAVHTLQ